MGTLLALVPGRVLQPPGMPVGVPAVGLLLQRSGGGRAGPVGTHRTINGTMHDVGQVQQLGHSHMISSAEQ
jgi:hypothetical protein